ncbi:MAG: XRE family transcriptional regulator, partial [Scytonema sp. PMC 1069.18]|nr:XRE family transcriptional regulator [Scytonema sp. PMC 1069.18]
MAISSELMQKLLPLLRPLMENENQRRGYLIRALGTDNPVLHRLVLNTSTNDFIPNLVNELVVFGNISPAKPGLCALLEVIREDVGEDIKLRIEELLQEI